MKNSFFESTHTKRIIFFILFDIFLSFITLLLSYELRFNFNISDIDAKCFYDVFYILITIKLLSFIFFKIYRFSWRYFSIVELKQLVYAHIVTYITFITLYMLWDDYIKHFARSIIIIDFFLSLVFIGALRVAKRVVLEGRSSSSKKNTILIGTSKIAQNIITNDKEYNVVAVIEDIKISIGTYFSGIKVKSIDNLDEIIKEDRVTSVIITKEYTTEKLNILYSKLAKNKITNIKIATLSDKEDRLKKLSVEDLLARHPKDLDKDLIENFIKDKVIMITGAGGSIGSEIARQCASFGAKKLILLDHSEFNLYTISEELKTYNIYSVMQSVVNLKKFESTFAKYRPQIVIHAAAYKHVPLCEENISEAIENNIMGTKNCIDLAIKYKADKFTLVSTDKAVRPTNVMGTTKRICELYASNVDSKTTEISAVRFGNVLGSSGSVIPKFKAQIEAGENITVTHKDITRYFMLIPEACGLVLQTATLAKGGELFILDMGEPIKIVDMAKKMIELSGRDDIQIEFTGLRAGEKLYEELLIDDSDLQTKYSSIMVVSKRVKIDIDILINQIEQLLISEDKLTKLKEIVPEFNHNG